MIRVIVQAGVGRLDQDSGPEAPDIEIRVGRQRGHGSQRPVGEQVHRVGVDIAADRGGIPGYLGELAHREHRQVRQRFIGAQPEDGSHIGLGGLRAAVLVTVGDRRQRSQFDLPVKVLRQCPVHRRVGAGELPAVGESDDHLGRLPGACVRRRHGGISRGAPQQPGQPLGVRGGVQFDIADCPGPVCIQTQFADMRAGHPFACHRLDRVPPDGDDSADLTHDPTLRPHDPITPTGFGPQPGQCHY